jgi:murein DD-endopeptidase MepM/ murein hydrolase activator NlpD
LIFIHLKNWRNGIVKKSASFILLLILFFSLTVVKAETLEEARKKLQDINNSINTNQNKLNEVNKKSAYTADELKILDQQMDQLADKLNDINDEKNTLNVEINKTDADIAECEKRIQEENELYKKRLRALYLEGNTGYLEVLLGAKNMSDLLQRAENIQKIAEFDKNLITSLVNDKKEVEAKKAEKLGKKSKLANLSTEAAAQQLTVQQKTEEKNKLMSSLVSSKAGIENQIQEDAQESKEVQSLISSILKAQEEAKKKNKTTTVKSSGKMFCVTGVPYAVTSPYGYRIHPVLGYKVFHAGMDLAVFWGTPVYSLMDGTVIASEAMSGYGNVVMINHGNIITLYAHLSCSKVKVGQTVKGGQQIALSGNTGRSTGPHLHFEVRNLKGETMNPANYYVK